MRSVNLTRKLLVRSVLLVINVSLVNAEILDFYQDAKPEEPVDINYERIARYLEAQKQATMRDVDRSRIVPNIPWPYDEYLDYRRQKENKILEALLENPSILDVLENRKSSREREDIQEQFPSRYDDLREDLTSGLNEALSDETRPYTNVEPSTGRRFNDYGNVKIPYTKSILKNEMPRYMQNSDYHVRMRLPENENYPIERAMNNAERLMKLEGKLMEINENRGAELSSNDENESLLMSEQEPEFTFKFDQPMTNEPNAFAVKPNDPRYYEDETSTMLTNTLDDNATTKHEKIVERTGYVVNEDERNEERTNNDIEYTTENIRNEKFSIMKIVLPEHHRRADPDSVIVSSSRMMSNDIYFIAIVAGCSAAAMFALVLISLTWCRLQRGAKAAADIEYPAYGVTGPNKDISPSGDQRLAHSAQMYHFQHQKQQIIAMENRTAASRDPGSVSEAESDEENEEGDYTVYECPGLASTGEMEVKNPLFHDDPTPATPPQIHKDGDDI